MTKVVLFLLVAAGCLVFVFNGDPIGLPEVFSGFVAGFAVTCAMSVALDLHERR